MLLASCRKRAGVAAAAQGSHLIISLAPSSAPADVRASPDLVVGKLRSDWSGGFYTAYDAGLSPAKAASGSGGGAAGGGKDADSADELASPGRTPQAAVRRGSVAAAAGTLRRELACMWFKFESAGPGTMT